MTVYTHFYIVVYTQRGCHTLKLTMLPWLPQYNTQQ